MSVALSKVVDASESPPHRAEAFQTSPKGGVQAVFQVHGCAYPGVACQGVMSGWAISSSRYLNSSGFFLTTVSLIFLNYYLVGKVKA